MGSYYIKIFYYTTIQGRDCFFISFEKKKK